MLGGRLAENLLSVLGDRLAENRSAHAGPLPAWEAGLLRFSRLESAPRPDGLLVL